MKPTRRKIVSLSAMLAIVAIVAVGCGGGSRIKPKAWNVSITKKDTPASIEVDVTGIREEEKAEWEGYSIDKYWTPGDPRRANADKWTRSLEMGKPEALGAKDPEWEKWRKPEYLVIIARLPGRFEPGSADPRRKIISLDKREWKGKTLEFEVRESAIRILTPRK